MKKRKTNKSNYQKIQWNIYEKHSGKYFEIIVLFNTLMVLKASFKSYAFYKALLQYELVFNY